MSAAPRTILLDTCIWVDSYLGTRSGSKTARKLIDAARCSGVELLYAATSVKDVFYLVVSSLKLQIRKSGQEVTEGDAKSIRQLAWSCLDDMAEVATAIGIDQSDIWLAGKLRSVHGDAEDNLVLAAASRSRADYLVTTDQALLSHATVAALTPQEMIKLIEAFA